MRSPMVFPSVTRIGIGFDSLFKAVESAQADFSGYPPYDIIKTGEDSYRITLAVAGFERNELDVSTQENALIVKGAKGEQKNNGEYLHRGIATREFTRKYQLLDYVEVKKAELSNGLLHIDLVREVPESKRSRIIDIAS